MPCVSPLTRISKLNSVILEMVAMILLKIFWSSSVVIIYIVKNWKRFLILKSVNIPLKFLVLSEKSSTNHLFYLFQESVLVYDQEP